jgi:hypothetical protein
VQWSWVVSIKQNIVTCYCEIFLVAWRCPVTQQCKYVSSSYIDDTGSSIPLLHTLQWTRREMFSMVIRLLSTDFCWFVELVHVGRFWEKVLLKESPAGVTWVVTMDGEDSPSSGLVNGRLVTDYTLRCYSGMQVDQYPDDGCPYMFGEFLIVFNCSVLSFLTEIIIHLE